MSEIPESPHTGFLITKAGAFTPEAVERLVAERDKFDVDRRTAMVAAERFREQGVADQARAEASLEALRKHGRHDVFCDSVSGIGACSCGLDAALGGETPRIIGYGVVVRDEPIPGVPSVRTYSFGTLEEAADATRKAWAKGCQADYAPIRRGDILPEEWKLSGAVAS